MIPQLSLALVLLSLPAWGASLDEAQKRDEVTRRGSTMSDAVVRTRRCSGSERV